MPIGPLPPDTVRARIDELVAAWRDDPHEALEAARRDGDVVAPTVYGLTAHTHALAAAIRLLEDAGGEPTMVPLVRQMLECAVTAMWVERYGSRAAVSVVRDDARNRLLTLKEFLEAGVRDDGSLDKLQASLDELDPANGRESERFYQRCMELEGMTGSYAIYRALSGVSHTSGMVVDLYVKPIDKTPERPLGIALAPQPKPWAPEAVCGIALTYLLFAGMAWDRVDRQHRSRTRLKQIGAEMGIKLEWTPSALGLRRQSAWARRQRELRHAPGRAVGPSD